MEAVRAELAKHAKKIEAGNPRKEMVLAAFTPYRLWMAEDHNTQSGRSGPVLVLARREGQLANRLMLGACLLAFAREHGLRFFNPALAEFTDWFQGSTGSPVAGWLPGNEKSSGKRRGSLPVWLRLALAVGSDRIAWLLAKIPGGGIPGLHAVDLTASHDRRDEDFDLNGQEFIPFHRLRGLLFLRGWKFRAEGLLQKHRPEILEYFRPLEETEERIEAFLRAARNETDLLIGVHIRQGDYAHWQGGRYFYPSRRFAEWMREAVGLFEGRRVRFLVCSNEPQEPATFEGLDTKFGPGNALADLFTLAGCDFLMGPPSTFTLWASFYGNVPLHMLTDKNQPLHLASFTHHPKF